MAEQKKILNHQQIQAKIKRLAHQIFENSLTEDSIVIYAIAENGFYIGEEISNILNASIYLKKHVLVKVKVDKKSPQNNIQFEGNNTEKNKIAFVIDDVTDSGKTMFYVCAHLLNFLPTQIKTVSLIDRNHRKFPIQVDFAGQLVSTTLNEKVKVDRTNNVWSAYLE